LAERANSKISDARRDSESTAVGLVPISFPGGRRFDSMSYLKNEAGVWMNANFSAASRNASGAACYSDIRPRITSASKTVEHLKAVREATTESRVLPDTTAKGIFPCIAKNVFNNLRTGRSSGHN